MVEIKLTLDEAAMLSAMITVVLQNPHMNAKNMAGLAEIRTKIIKAI